MADRIGLIGQPALCILGEPQRTPGVDPEAKRKLYVASDNLFFIFLKFLFSLSSKALRQ